MQATQTVWQQTYRLDQLSLTVSADDLMLFEKLQHFVGGHWLEEHTSNAALSTITLAFHTRVSRPTLPLLPTPQLPLEQGTAFSTEQGIYLVIQNAWLIIEARPASTINVYLPAAANSEAIGLLFTQALQAALRRADCFELHAAALVSPHGTGLLFIGDSGCGKSTLTVRLAAQGWRYLTDDSLLVCQRETELCVTPLRRVFALTPQTLRACGRSFEPTRAEKIALEPAGWFPRRHIPQFTPRHLIFPRLTYEPRSKLASLTQANAMMRLMYHSPWACFDTLTSRAHIERLTQLAQTTRAWELQAGRDLLELPDAAATLLAELDTP